MPRVHLNIGSNLGDRLSNLQRAAASVRQLAFSSLLSDVADVDAAVDWRQSDAVESAPWGYESSNPYLNVGVSFETEIPAAELLAIIKNLEQTLGSGAHRNPDGTYADRLVDIDIIFYGDLEIDTPELTLPHPRWHQRDFVISPLRQIDPTWLQSHS